MKIKVTDSKPSPLQCEIENLIGKEFDAAAIYEDGRFTGRVEIYSKEFGGKIILQSDEFIKV